MAKYLKIADFIKEGISQESYSDGFIPSEGSLCKDFGVSRITVRKALKLLEDQQFLASIPGKGWKIADKNDFPEKPHVKNIACICFSELPAYGIALNALRENAEKAGYQASMLFIDNSGIKRIKEELTPDNYCGIICIGQIASSSHTELAKSGLPVVCVGYHHPDAPDCVCVDNYAGGWLAARHLISFGHKNFLIINDLPDKYSEFKKRENGFIAALESNCRAETCTLSNLSNALSANSPSAIFITTDTYVLPVLETLKEKKIKIPMDLSVVGYDNFVNNPAPPEIAFDSFEQPWDIIGKASFERILEKLNNPDDYRKIEFRPTLIKRGSVVKI
jgi:GntR family transcriptional regulator of arabinose operon